MGLMEREKNPIIPLKDSIPDSVKRFRKTRSRISGKQKEATD